MDNNADFSDPSSPLVMQAPVSDAPICPHCAQDPALVASRGPILVGNLYTMVLYCGNPKCRKIWTVAVIGTEQPKIVKPPFQVS